MNPISSPTLPMSSMSSTCTSDLRVFWLNRSASYPPLLSLTGISSSSIFGMRPTPNAQSTDALRTHARRSKFASRPAGFGLLSPDKLWSLSKNLPRRLGSRFAFGTLRASVNRIRGKSKTRS